MHITIKYAASFNGDAFEILKKDIVEYPHNFEHILYKKKGGQNTKAPEMTVFSRDNMMTKPHSPGNNGRLLSRFIHKVYYRGKSISKWG